MTTQINFALLFWCSLKLVLAFLTRAIITRAFLSVTIFDGLYFNCRYFVCALFEVNPPWQLSISNTGLSLTPNFNIIMHGLPSQTVTPGSERLSCFGNSRNYSCIRFHETARKARNVWVNSICVRTRQSST